MFVCDAGDDFDDWTNPYKDPAGPGDPDFPEDAVAPDTLGDLCGEAERALFDAITPTSGETIDDILREIEDGLA
ncbi:MAG: hypothetical protein FWB94_08990 [Chitinispirillia bacterium]|nr:hypothetical protein [Chitinispirillia bacterium]